MLYFPGLVEEYPKYEAIFRNIVAYIKARVPSFLPAIGIGIWYEHKGYREGEDGR